MTRGLGSLTVRPRQAALPAVIGAQPAVIPLKAHWTPDPLTREAVASARSTALLRPPGLMTAAEQARQAQPPVGTLPKRSRGRGTNATLRPR
jgi:hypothetical protein